MLEETDGIIISEVAQVASLHIEGVTDCGGGGWLQSEGFLSVWFTQLRNQWVQTQSYPPYSLTSRPWRSDVTGQLGMSRPQATQTPLPPPARPLRYVPWLPFLSSRLQSPASHCDPGPPMRHVPMLMERQPGVSCKQ